MTPFERAVLYIGFVLAAVGAWLGYSAGHAADEAAQTADQALALAKHNEVAGRRLTKWANDKIVPWGKHWQDSHHTGPTGGTHEDPPPPPPNWDDPP